jgi:hypothetical protein
VGKYSVNPKAVAHAEKLIDARQYVLESDWGAVQPTAAEQNAFLEKHSWEEYAQWHLGLTEGAADETKARYALLYGPLLHSADPAPTRLPRTVAVSSARHWTAHTRALRGRRHIPEPEDQTRRRERPARDSA